MRPQKAITQEVQANKSSPSGDILYRIENADAFGWLQRAEMNSIHAIVTDPPYGLVEYSEKEFK